MVKHSLALSDTLLSCQIPSCLVRHSCQIRLSNTSRLVRRNIHKDTAHSVHGTCSYTYIIYLYIIIINVILHIMFFDNCCDVRWLKPLTIPSVQCTNSTSAAAHAEPTRRVSSSPISSLRSSQSSLVELGNHGKAKLGNTMKYTCCIFCILLFYSLFSLAILFATLSQCAFSLQWHPCDSIHFRGAFVDDGIFSCASFCGTFVKTILHKIFRGAFATMVLAFSFIETCECNTL